MRAATAWILAVCLQLVLGHQLTFAQTPGGTEIHNVASGIWSPITPVGTGLPPPQRIIVDSNMVVTPVLGVNCFSEVALGVDPGGTVAPGDSLTYALTLVNGNGGPLDDVVVEMPLDPGLDPPTALTQGTAPIVGGGSVPCTGNYDSLTRTVTWVVSRLEDGQGVVLSVTAPTRADLAADTFVVESAEVFSAVCPDRTASNQQVTPVVPPVLQVFKNSDRSTAIVGDGVVFRFEVRHAGSEPDLVDVVLVDTLPPELRYVPGSARVDGEPFPDPLISPDGLTLSLPLGDLTPGEQRFVSLATIVIPTAEKDEIVNRAYGQAVTVAGSPLQSATASAVVSIIPGPFRQEAYLLGRVFVDDNGNQLPDPREPGVPGVLVRLENGRAAITDVNGRWHIDGVRPGLHVMRLDPTTLPPGLSPSEGGMEWAGTATTRFLETRASTVVVAHMPLGPAGSPRCSFVADRRRVDLPLASLWAAGEISPSGEAVLLWVARHFDGRPEAALLRVTCDEAPGDPAKVLDKRLDRLLPERFPDTIPPIAGAVEVPEIDREKAEQLRLEGVLRTAAPQAAILIPANASRATRSRIDVEVIHPDSMTPHLTLNGRLVAPDRIGTSAVLPSRGIAAARYIAVELQRGGNTFEFRAVPVGADPSTVVPVRSVVTLPDLPVELRIHSPEGGWIADGATPGELMVEAVDGTGMRSPVKMVVTVETDGSPPLTRDLQPDEPGLQVALEDGRAELQFAPRTIPGRTHVIAFTERMEVEAWVDVRSGGGAWQVTGLAEGQLTGDAGIEGDGGLPPGIDENISDSGGRVALFARGPVGAASRVTVSVDTDRERDRDQLTNWFEPDLFYPVAGDASVQLDEAASQGKFFARIDGPRGFAQYGDFFTGVQQSDLARYDRRMTGALGRVEAGRFAFEGFASSSDQQVVREVFEADGSSGPFLLAHAPLVARSETVFVEVRDRFETDRVLSRQIRLPDVDYTLDPIAGTLLFRGPIPAFDPDLNPIRVVVLYESRTGGDDRVTGGGRVSFRPYERLEIGATGVFEERVGENLGLYAADLAWRPTPGTSVRAEVATTDAVASATAVALEVNSRPGPKVGWDLYYRDLPLDFANPTYLGSPELGSTRYGGRVEWQPEESWRIKAEAFAQEDSRVDLKRKVALVDAEKRIGRITALGGVRSVRSESATLGETDSTLLRAGVRGRMTARLTGELLREQALGGSTAPGFPTRTAVGLAYQVRPGVKAFLRQEWESGEGPLRDRTVAGVESQINERTRAMAQYSLDNVAGASAMRALTGIETVLPIDPRNSVSFSVSRLDTTQGDRSLDYTTLAGGYEHRAGPHLVSARYEVRRGTRDRRHLMTATGAFQPHREWTVFIRERWFFNDVATAFDVWRAEGLFGAAYRPAAGRFRVLARLDHSTGNNAIPTTPGGVVSGTAVSEPGSSVSTPSPTYVPPGVGLRYDRILPRRDSLSLSIGAGARLTGRQRVAISGVFRHVADDPTVGLPSTLTSLLSAHYTIQVHRRWMLGGSARRFGEGQTSTASYGYGAEVSFLAIKNLWLTGGYNIAGFEDGDFPVADRTARGPFVSVRFKFDEQSLTNWSDLRLDR